MKVLVIQALQIKTVIYNIFAHRMGIHVNSVCDRMVVIAYEHPGRKTYTKRRITQGCNQ